MNCPYNVKICSKCKKILIVCELNFFKRKDSKDGFRSECKDCHKKHQNQYKEKHKKEIKEYQKQYKKEHKEEIAEYQNQYKEKYEEEITEYKKQWYKEHKKEIKEYQKQYREEHKEGITEYQNQWRKENSHKTFNNHNKRRQLEESQGNGITNEQLYEMYKFFNGECAYSGIKLKKGINNSIDHIIALSIGGLNEIWNIVPMHKPYNSSKWKNDMEQWYRQQEYFSEERLEKIYEWCEYAWNKWGYK